MAGKMRMNYTATTLFYRSLYFDVLLHDTRDDSELCLHVFRPIRPLRLYGATSSQSTIATVLMPPASSLRALQVIVPRRISGRRYASHGPPQFNEPSGWLFGERVILYHLFGNSGTLTGCTCS